MGMYTELIFGASLKKSTPENIIHDIQQIVDWRDEKIDEMTLKTDISENTLQRVFCSSSFYFGVHTSLVYFRNEDGEKILSIRTNCKNYNGEIQEFLEWIEPYVEYGSGTKDMYAIVTYEEDSEPTIYYKKTRVEEDDDMTEKEKQELVKTILKNQTY